MKKTLLTLLAVGGLALAGCGEKERSKAWTESDIQKYVMPIISVPHGGNPSLMDQSEMYIEDIDKDGKADYIQFARTVRFVAEGYMEKVKGQRVIQSENAPIMTPKMREAASKAMNAQRDFAREYLKSKGRYKEK